MGTFHINCTVISFTQDLQFVLAIRAHSRHCNMAGILLYFLPAISGDLIFLRKYIYQCIRVIQIISPYQTELG